MDFLSLMIIYVITFAISSLVFLTGSKHSNIKVIRWLFIYGEKVSSFLWSSVIPTSLQHCLTGFTDRFLYTRNPVFQVIYFVLWIIIFLQFSLETNVLLRKFNIHPVAVTLTYAGFFVNLLLFLCSSWINPGVITKLNYKKFLGIYPYDNWMFKKKIKCDTCEIVKPARSKHCAICNHCVHRFDHHCSWINNCVGAQNVGYFLAFLLSITVQCALVATLSTLSMYMVAETTGLLRASYLDANKVRRPVNIFIIVQHLFLQRPFFIFIASALWILVILTGAFLSYHIYLACTNQTTNERYKLSELGSKYKKQTLNDSEVTDGKKPRYNYNFYNRGIYRNLREVFQGYQSQ